MGQKSFNSIESAQSQNYYQQQAQIYRWRSNRMFNEHLARVYFSAQNPNAQRSRISEIMQQKSQQTYFQVSKMIQLAKDKYMYFEKYINTLESYQSSLYMEECAYVLLSLLEGFQQIFKKFLKKIVVLPKCCFVTNTGEVRAWINSDPTKNDMQQTSESILDYDRQPELNKTKHGINTEPGILKEIFKIIDIISTNDGRYIHFNNKLRAYLAKDILHHWSFIQIRKFINAYVYHQRIVIASNIKKALFRSENKDSRFVKSSNSSCQERCTESDLQSEYVDEFQYKESIIKQKQCLSYLKNNQNSQKSNRNSLASDRNSSFSSFDRAEYTLNLSQSNKALQPSKMVASPLCRVSQENGCTNKGMTQSDMIMAASSRHSADLKNYRVSENIVFAQHSSNQSSKITKRNNFSQIGKMQTEQSNQYDQVHTIPILTFQEQCLSRQNQEETKKFRNSNDSEFTVKYEQMCIIPDGKEKKDQLNFNEKLKNKKKALKSLTVSNTVQFLDEKALISERKNDKTLNLQPQKMLQLKNHGKQKLNDSMVSNYNFGHQKGNSNLANTSGKRASKNDRNVQFSPLNQSEQQKVLITRSQFHKQEELISSNSSSKNAPSPQRNPRPCMTVKYTHHLLTNSQLSMHQSNGSFVSIQKSVSDYHGILANMGRSVFVYNVPDKNIQKAETQSNLHKSINY